MYCGTVMFFSEDSKHEYMPATERIPLELMKPFLKKGHEQDARLQVQSASTDKAGNKPKVVFMLSTFHNLFMVDTSNLTKMKIIS